MTSTDTTLAAYAVTVEGYGDLDVTVVRIDTDRDGQEHDTEVASSGPLSDGHDLDAVLAALGYERVGEWDTTDWGGVCDVQPLT